MSDNLLTEQLQKKWQPVLEHPEMPEIKDEYRKATTAVLLENQEQSLNEAHANAVGGGMSPHVGGEGNIAGFDPILISLVRRAMPNLIAYDICGVQPMTGPTGLIFAMRAKYANATALESEAFYNEAGNTAGGSGDHVSGAGQEQIARGNTGDPYTTDPLGVRDVAAAGGMCGGYQVGAGHSTSVAEGLTPARMGFSIERIAVEAHSRALQAEYTTELAQDLKAVHGLDAEAELANILSTEILAEINREVIRNINITAVLGAGQSDLAAAAGGITLDGFTAGGPNHPNKGVYDLRHDSDGRWSAERFRGLQFQIERECNEIAKQTRRGKGNIVICSSDVASALSMSGILDHAPAFGNLEVDDTGNTFVGVLNGRIKVYVDPYAGSNYVTVGYRGSSQYDAGVFYCPYVPLQMARAVDSTTYQPKIAFKTRYGLVNNPFAQGADTPSFTKGQTPLAVRANEYYRIFRVDNLHGLNSGDT
jgi:hypothetical protein